MSMPAEGTGIESEGEILQMNWQHLTRPTSRELARH